MASAMLPRRGTFRLYDLPSELRLRIYEMALYTDKTIDLHHQNYIHIQPKLALLIVDRQTYEEAYPVFYSQTISLFPQHGRFFTRAKPLITRLPTHYRSVISSVELRLGPGFAHPPQCQNTDDSLGLRDCVNLRTLKIFIECDPSDDWFEGFRGKNQPADWYANFCSSLLDGIFDQVPSLEAVQIDAYPSVKKSANIVVAIRRKIEDAGKRLTWGPLRKWEMEGNEDLGPLCEGGYDMQRKQKVDPLRDLILIGINC